MKHRRVAMNGVPFMLMLSSLLTLVVVAVSSCGDDSVLIPTRSVDAIAPTPTFIVVVLTPTPTRTPIPTVAPDPDADEPEGEDVYISFPEELEPDSLNPPQDGQTVLRMWEDFLSDAMVMREDEESLFHICGDGNLLIEGIEGITWRLGWTENMTWRRWWQIALFVRDPTGNESLAAILRGENGELFTSTSGDPIPVFKSDQC